MYEQKPRFSCCLNSWNTQNFFTSLLKCVFSPEDGRPHMCHQQPSSKTSLNAAALLQIRRQYLECVNSYSVIAWQWAQYLWGDENDGIWNIGTWLSAAGISRGCCSDSLNLLLEWRALAVLWVAEKHTGKCEQTQGCHNSSSYHAGGEKRLVV